MKPFIALLSLFLSPALLMAQESRAEAVPATCRSLFTTSAGLTGPGLLEWEFGGQKIHYQDGSESLLFPTQFNLGVCRWFDLRLGWNGPTYLKDGEGRSESGGTDPFFGGQALVLGQENAGIDLGLAYWHKLPRCRAKNGIRTGRHDDTLVATFSHASGRWLLDVNAGANWIGRPDAAGRVRQGVISAAVTCAPALNWNVSLDTYALGGTELGPRSISSILAVSRQVTPTLTVDVAVEAGLSKSAPRLAFNAGLVWRAARFWTAS